MQARYTVEPSADSENRDTRCYDGDLDIVPLVKNNKSQVFSSHELILIPFWNVIKMERSSLGIPNRMCSFFSNQTLPFLECDQNGVLFI